MKTIRILDILVPEKVREIARKFPDDSSHPDFCCSDFNGAFEQYLKSRLCSDSLYNGVKVKMKVDNLKPIEVTMNSRGPPEYLNIRDDYVIIKKDDLEVPEINAF